MGYWGLFPGFSAFFDEHITVLDGFYTSYVDNFPEGLTPLWKRAC